MTERTAEPSRAPADRRLVDDVCRRVGVLRGDLEQLVRADVERLAPLHAPEARAAIVREVLAQLTGLGPLDALLCDPDVDEVLVNAGCDVWAERHGILERVGSLGAERVEHLVERVLAPLGRRLDRSSPIVDARLPDGSRVCVVLPPISVDGPALSIRRLPQRARPLDAFTDAAGAALCADLLARRVNVIVCGATSSGKTSLLAALVARCAPGERLIVVEDTTELVVADRHALRLEARPPSVDGPPPIGLEQLVRTALRLRPDRIVVGEIRGDEVVALVQAMNTGHDGSLATCHANGPLDALLRLESLVLRAVPSWPLPAIRQQLARSVDVVVHVARRPDGQRRIVSIDEVVPNDEGQPAALRTLARGELDGGGLTVVAPAQRNRRSGQPIPERHR